MNCNANTNFSIPNKPSSLMTCSSISTRRVMNTWKIGFTCCYVCMALNFYRYKTFIVFKSVTFEIIRKYSENVGFDANNDLQEDLKFFKSDSFENYKSFVPAEVQNHGNNNNPIKKILEFGAS